MAGPQVGECGGGLEAVDVVRARAETDADTDRPFTSLTQPNLDHLSATAGHVPVKVEPIHPKLGHFGTAAKRRVVQFQEYLAKLSDPSEKGKWYLTTQYEESDDDSEDSDDDDGPVPTNASRKRKDREGTDVSDSESVASASTSASSSSSSSIILDIPGESQARLSSDFRPPPLDPLLPSPTNALADEFPLQPELMGHLVLQQTNLWLGSCKEGKSSGLHHDFHDNLYALLAGRKRFLLFPPLAFEYLHPRGTVERVHANGLIEYTPRGALHVDDPLSPRLPIRPDGLPPAEAACWRLLARRAAVQQAYDEAAKQSGEDHLPSQRRKGKGKMTDAQAIALKKLEDCQEEVMRYMELEREYEQGGDEFDERLFEDDDEELPSDEQTIDSSSSEEESDSEEDEESLNVAHQLMQRAMNGDQQALRIVQSFMQQQGGGGSDADGDEDEDDEDDEDDAGLGEAESDSESSGSEGGMFAAAGSDDDDAEDSDEDDTDRLVMMRKAGQLPGGLRQDSDDSDEFENDYDGVISGDVLLGGDEELIMGVPTGGASDDDYVDDEEQLAVLEELQHEAAQRMRDRNAERRREASIVALRRGISAENAADDGEDDEHDSDADSEPDAGLRAALMAHVQAGGQVIMEGEGNESPSEDDDEDGSDGDNAAAFAAADSDDEEAHLAQLLASAKEGGQALAVFDGGSDDDEEDEDDDAEEDSESSDSESGMSDQVLMSVGNQTDGSDWGGDVDDTEAVLEALAAQAATAEANGKGHANGGDSAKRDLGKFAPAQQTVQEEQEPLSFSKIDPMTLHRHFNIRDSIAAGGPAAASNPSSRPDQGGRKRQMKPRRGCPPPLVAELQPGQMLYLPTSWWHEVTSEASGAGSDVHMALNWWFHPPDHLSAPKRKAGRGASAASAAAADPMDDPFTHPYRDAEVWDFIRAKVRRRLERARRQAAKGTWRRGAGTNGGGNAKGKGKVRERDAADSPAGKGEGSASKKQKRGTSGGSGEGSGGKESKAGKKAGKKAKKQKTS